MQHFVRGEGKLSIPSQQGAQHANDRRRLAANAKLAVPGTPRKQSNAPTPSVIPAFGAHAPFSATQQQPAFSKPFRPASALSHQRNFGGQNENVKHKSHPGRDAYDTDAESLDTTIHGAQSVTHGEVQVKDSQAPEYHQEYSEEIDHLLSDEEGERQSNDEVDFEDGQERIDPQEVAPSKTHFLDRRLFDEKDLKSYPTTTSGHLENEDTQHGGASSEPEADPAPSPSPQKPHRRRTRSQVLDPYATEQARQASDIPVHSAAATRKLPEVGASRSKSYPNLLTQGSDRPRNGHPTKAQVHVSDHSRQQAAALRATNKPQTQHFVQPIARPTSAAERPNYQTAHDTPRAQNAQPQAYTQFNGQPTSYSQSSSTPGNDQDIDTPVRELLVHVKPQPAKTQSVKNPATAQQQHQRESSLVEEEVLEDYDRPGLLEMDYTKLKTESFDTIPRGNPSPLEDEMRTAPLKDRLETVHQNLQPDDQIKFFSSITTHEWEEAGDWFLGRFGDLIKRMTEARKEKRKWAIEFENEIEKRHQHVSKRHKTVEDAMAKMRNRGQTLLPRSPRRD